MKKASAVSSSTSDLDQLIALRPRLARPGAFYDLGFSGRLWVDKGHAEP
jgi:hypothetical protein